MSMLAHRVQADLLKAIDRDDLVLPTLPEVALNIRKAAENPEISVSHLSKVISRSMPARKRSKKKCAMFGAKVWK